MSHYSELISIGDSVRCLDRPDAHVFRVLKAVGPLVFLTGGDVVHVSRLRKLSDFRSSDSTLPNKNHQHANAAAEPSNEA